MNTRRVMRKILTEAQGGVYRVYHGSPDRFEKFERRPGKRYVLFSEFDVESPAHFFTPLVTDAKEFGRHISAWKITVRNPLFNYPADPHLATDFDPQTNEVLKYILEPMVEHTVVNHVPRKSIDFGVGRFDFDPEQDDRWPYLAVDSGGLKWDVADCVKCVERMVELGYDGTTVSETNTYAGYSWAIFSPAQAQFIRHLSADEVDEAAVQEDQ